MRKRNTPFPLPAVPGPEPGCTAIFLLVPACGPAAQTNPIWFQKVVLRDYTVV